MGRATLTVNKTDNIQLTLEVTMSKSDWVELRERIQEGKLDHWPAHRFLGVIDDLIRQADVHFSGEICKDTTV